RYPGVLDEVDEGRVGRLGERVRDGEGAGVRARVLHAVLAGWAAARAAVAEARDLDAVGHGQGGVGAHARVHGGGHGEDLEHGAGARGPERDGLRLEATATTLWESSPGRITFMTSATPGLVGLP